MFSFVKSRDISIDLLRFFGLSLIILAHVNPPELEFQLRTFDVPLMLFVSGLAFSDKKPDFSASFFFKRLKRLVIPVYIFLTAYFCLVFIAKHANIDLGVRWHHVVGSYLLMDGIGYVWVIRVFLIVGLLTPLFLFFEDKIKNHILFFGVLAGILTVDELLLANGIGIKSTFFREFVFYAIGYGLMFLIGLHFKRINARVKGSILGLLTICFGVVLLFENSKSGGIYINNYKYPPRALFLLYGAIMSFLSVEVVTIFIRKIHIPKFLIFIGQNTIWIYLYHIPLIQLTGMMSLPYSVRYLTVYALAAFIVYIQNLVVFKFKFPFNKYLIW